MAQADISFDYPDKSPGFLLWQVTNLWQKIQRKALSEMPFEDPSGESPSPHDIAMGKKL